MWLTETVWNDGRVTWWNEHSEVVCEWRADENDPEWTVVVARKIVVNMGYMILPPDDTTIYGRLDTINTTRLNKEDA